MAHFKFQVLKVPKNYLVLSTDSFEPYVSSFKCLLQITSLLWNIPMFLNGMIILLKTVESVNVQTEEILVVKLCELGCCTFGSKYFRVQLGKHHIAAAVSKPSTNWLLMFTITEAEIQTSSYLDFVSFYWFFSVMISQLFCLCYNYTDLELFKCFLFSWLTFISEQ